MKFSDYDYHSAQKRSAEKIGQTLRWLYKWEVSSRQVLSELLEIERSATYQTLSKFEKQGLISSFSMSNCRSKIYHLSEQGVAAARELFVGKKDEHLKTKFYPSKINTNHCHHDFLVQQVVLDLMKMQENSRFLSDRQLRLREKLYLRNGYKIPDAVVHLGSHKNPNQILVEVQESPLPSFRLELMLSLYAEAIRKDDIQGLILASTKRHILSHVNKIILRGVRHFNFIENRWQPISTSVRNSPLSPEMVGGPIKLIDLSGLAAHYYNHIIR
jgi:DNA-binding PadR family transcriptional regulator